MKKLLLLTVLFLGLALPACQCSGGPPVGPVEDQTTAS